MLPLRPAPARYLTSATSSLRRTTGASAPGLFCHDCTLAEIKKPADGYVLATCGHLMCKGCIHNLYLRSPLVKGQSIRDLKKGDVVFRFGAKTGGYLVPT